jgi:hypothetical protein
MWAVTLASGQEWQTALSRMPLGAGIRELNETNCVAVMLRAFRSNAVVKGLVFLPGATDEFYLVHRAKAQLAQASPTLLDAVAALANQTRIRATFQAPLLLLHTTEDRLQPAVQTLDARTVEKLKRRSLPSLLCIDRDWEYVQPLLKWPLKLEVRPWQRSADSYHFYRHNFVGYGLSGWEALEATALAGKTRFTVTRKRVVFEMDSGRAGP